MAGIGQKDERKPSGPGKIEHDPRLDLGRKQYGELGNGGKGGGGKEGGSGKGRKEGGGWSSRGGGGLTIDRSTGPPTYPHIHWWFATQPRPYYLDNNSVVMGCVVGSESNRANNTAAAATLIAVRGTHARTHALTHANSCGSPPSHHRRDMCCTQDSGRYRSRLRAEFIGRALSLSLSLSVRAVRARESEDSGCRGPLVFPAAQAGRMPTSHTERWQLTRTDEDTRQLMDRVRGHVGHRRRTLSAHPPNSLPRPSPAIGSGISHAIVQDVFCQAMQCHAMPCTIMRCAAGPRGARFGSDDLGVIVHGDDAPSAG